MRGTPEGALHLIAQSRRAARASFSPRSAAKPRLVLVWMRSEKRTPDWYWFGGAGQVDPCFLSAKPQVAIVQNRCLLSTPPKTNTKRDLDSPGALKPIPNGVCMAQTTTENLPFLEDEKREAVRFGWRLIRAGRPARADQIVSASGAGGDLRAADPRQRRRQRPQP